MKTFMFRCIKITFEEKKNVRYTGGEESHSVETLVSVLFEQADEAQRSVLHGYGNVCMYISDEQFKELGYRVGQVYALSPT
jgi:hypothetical protein